MIPKTPIPKTSKQSLMNHVFKMKSHVTSKIRWNKLGRDLDPLLSQMWRSVGLVGTLLCKTSVKRVIVPDSIVLVRVNHFINEVIRLTALNYLKILIVLNLSFNLNNCLDESEVINLSFHLRLQFRIYF